MARPKRVFTDEEITRIGDYALVGCQNQTIAILMDIPKTTFTRRFGHLLHKKRSERRYNLRNNQTNLSEHNPAMAIFLGKNELGQVDKQVIADESKQRELDEAQKAEARRIASIRLHQGVA